MIVTNRSFYIITRLSAKTILRFFKLPSPIARIKFKLGYLANTFKRSWESSWALTWMTERAGLVWVTGQCSGRIDTSEVVSIFMYVCLFFKWENSFWINNLHIFLGLSTPGISLSLSSANPGEKERSLCPWDHGIQKIADAESRWTNVCFLVNFHPFCFLVRLFNYVLRFTSVKRVYFPFCIYWL